jgi:alkylglycerol monooxygenase
MSPTQVIVLATPVFFLLIGIEFAWGLAKKRNTYRLNDAISSISLGMLSQTSAVFTRLFRITLYAWIYGFAVLWHNEAFWLSWYGWLLALVFYDFCYYWQHRVSHRSALFWASHVVHHQSQDYNLSTALRQPSSAAFVTWIFYVPMALAGVPPLVYGVVALVDLLYQYWVHTEHVGKLGWFDRWFCSPSNHRVHHAVNDEYLDRNYGGILILWDRIFGSFREESHASVYGTRSPLDSWDPLWSNAEIYWALCKDSWHAQRWTDKLRVWFRSPGWRPADVAARFPKRAFDIAQVERFDPPLAPFVAWFAAAQFSALLAGVIVFLWNADSMRLQQSSVWFAVLAAGLWSVGAVVQGRISVMQVLLIEVCALATATGAQDLADAHRVFKPLAMLLAIGCVVERLGLPSHRDRFRALLLAGLAVSLVGDCFLMFPGYFIPGLVSFLVTHLCYIALFRDRMAWFPSRRALVTTLAVGAAMYAFLYNGLNPVLKIAVAAYVIVIALMAAQAIGRATLMRNRSSLYVAVGAGLFMLSDSLFATNKFALPLPMAQFGVLATYYAAQVLIACNASPPVSPAAIHSENSSPALLGGATPR